MKHSKPVHTLLNVETEDSANENSLFVGQLFVGDIQNTDCRAELRVCDVPVTFKLDTGAQANVLPVSTYRRIRPIQQLLQTKTVLTAFGNVKIKPVGVIKLRVTCPDTKRNQVMEFFVTDTDDIPILGKDACQSMNLVKRVHIDGVTTHSKGITKDDLLTDYSDVFSGVGMFEQEYDIEVDPSACASSYTGTSEDAIRKVRPTQRDNHETRGRRDNCQRRQTNRLGAQSGNHREAKRVTADMP